MEGRRRRILAAPPLFVMPEELLKELLGKNQMEKAKCSRILKVYARERERMETILAHSPVSDELSQVTKENMTNIR